MRLEGILRVSLKLIWIVILLLAGGLFGMQSEKDRIEQEEQAETVTDIAIVNLDEGIYEHNKKKYYSTELMNLEADNLVAENLETARQGINNGSYAAYILIPSEFSNHAVSINATPQKATLEFAINPNLREDVSRLTMANIKNFEISLNTNMSYMYVQAILSEFHQVQDSAGTIMANDNAELARLMEINPENLLENLEFAEIERISADMEAVDFDEKFDRNMQISKDLQDNYDSFVEEGEKAFEEVKEGETGVTEGIENFYSIVAETDVAAGADGTIVYADGIEALAACVGDYEKEYEEQKNMIAGMLGAATSPIPSATPEITPVPGPGATPEATPQASPSPTPEKIMPQLLKEMMEESLEEINQEIKETNNKNEVEIKNIKQIILDMKKLPVTNTLTISKPNERKASEKKENQQESPAPPEEEKQPDKTVPPEEEKQPDSTVPPEEEKQPDSTVPPEEENQPDSTVPPEEEKQPDSTDPPEEEKQPDSTDPPEEEKQPDSTVPPENRELLDSSSVQSHSTAAAASVKQFYLLAAENDTDMTGNAFAGTKTMAGYLQELEAAVDRLEKVEEIQPGDVYKEEVIHKGLQRLLKEIDHLPQLDTDTWNSIFEEQILLPLEEEIQAENQKIQEEGGRYLEVLDAYLEDMAAFDAYEYFDYEKMDELLYGFGENMYDLEEQVTASEEGYLNYVSDTYEYTEEAVDTLHENLEDAYQGTGENVQKEVDLAKQYRQKINAQNVALLDEFTQKLLYTRVGNLEYVQAYDFIVKPIQMSDTSVPGSRISLLQDFNSLRNILIMMIVIWCLLMCVFLFMRNRIAAGENPD